MKTNRIILIFSFLLLVATEVIFSATLATERIGYVDIDRVYAQCPEVKQKEEERKTEIDKRNKLIKARKEELKKLSAEYEALKSSQTFELKRYEAEKKKYDEFFVTLEQQKKTESSEPVINESPATVVNESSAPVVETGPPEQVQQTVPPPPVEIREPDPPRPVLISETDIKKAEDNIKALQEEINFQEKGYDDNISKYDNAVQYNILGRIYEAIKEIAEENNYTIILDRRTVLFYMKESEVTDLVIEKLLKK